MGSKGKRREGRRWVISGLFAMGSIPRSLLRLGWSVGACLQVIQLQIACKQPPTKERAAGTGVPSADATGVRSPLKDPWIQYS